MSEKSIFEHLELAFILWESKKKLVGHDLRCFKNWPTNRLVGLEGGGGGPGSHEC